MKQSKSNNAYQLIEADSSRSETNWPHGKRSIPAFESLLVAKIDLASQNMSGNILRM